MVKYKKEEFVYFLLFTQFRFCLKLEKPVSLTTIDLLLAGSGKYGLLLNITNYSKTTESVIS
jgi:hypothetical protein